MSAVVESNTATAEEQQSCMKPGAFCWNEMIGRNTEASAKFYSGLFGWKSEPFHGDVPYTIFKSNGQPVAGLMACPDSQMAPQWLAYVMVEDVDASVKKAANLGAKIMLEPKDIPTVGRIAVIQDPQGAEIGVFRPESTGPEKR